ncbi:MAG: metal ABC transporter substrate-binding protein [bacterium]|nr:metal ABC transporter substrate-binding protein [bacterium]
MAALALLISGCGNDDDSGSDGLPTIMATTSIWADVVANVACDGQAEVITLIPPGGDPHAFQPSLQDRGRMENAVMIVANGLDLEEGLGDTLEAVEEAGTPVFHMADHIETIGFAPGMELEHHDEDEGDDHGDEEEGDDHGDEEEGDDHGDEDEGDDHGDEDEGDDHGDEDEGDEEGGHGHSGEDPHVWFDPVRVADALVALSNALASQAGLDTDVLSACVTEYRGELIALDAEIEEILSPLHHEDRLMLTNHDALGYFANRYDFELVGTVIPGGSSIGEANPAELQELIGLIEQTGVPAIFAESSHSSDDAEALARQAGVEVVVLDTGSLGRSGSGSDTYLGFMRTNAQRIADSLG